MENELALKVENIKKRYRLGVIGGGTLQGDLQSWYARLRGKEDPNSKIGEHIDTRQGYFMALKGISFEVKKGERLGIIGGNGAGKSTTLKILSRVTAPTEGTVYINGRISSMLEVGTGFHPELTGRENIYLNGAILGMSKEEVDRKIKDIIDFSECGRFIDTPVKRYSSGMYVKLAFSVAAHLDSEILIMDEVLAVGDMKFQQKCMEKMQEVSDREGRTILYVSHNMNTIRQLCERCIVLREGEIVFDGEVEDAISIYLGNDQRKSESDILIKQEMRDPEYQNPDIIIEHLHFEEKLMLKIGDQISFDIKLRNKSEMKRSVFLRVMVRGANGTVITMSSTELPISLEPNLSVVKNFIFDVSNLVPGRYSLSFVLYEIGAYGVDQNIEVIRDVCAFVITSKVGFNHDMTWKPQYWGYIYNGYLKEKSKK